MDFYDLKDFNDPHQAFNDPKGISVNSLDFDNPNCGGAAIFDGLVNVYPGIRK